MIAGILRVRNEAHIRGEPWRSKWDARRGKAIHDGVSDFGAPLCRWDDRHEYGFPLAPDVQPVGGER